MKAIAHEPLPQSKQKAAYARRRSSHSGQASIEYAALTVGFLMLLVPILFFIMSYSSATSDTVKSQQVSVGVKLLKEYIELAYANCPYKTRVLLAMPDKLESIKLEEEKGVYFLKIKEKGATYIQPVSIGKPSDIDIFTASGKLEGGGNKLVEISCNTTVDRMNMRHMTIGMKEGWES